MNLEKNHNSGVVINPTILPARNRNIPFAIPIPNLIWDNYDISFELIFRSRTRFHFR